MIDPSSAGEWVLTVPGSGPPPTLLRADWLAFAALAHRLANQDPFLMVRLRSGAGQRRMLAWLPSGALVGSTVLTPPERGTSDQPTPDERRVLDVTTQAGALIRWLDGDDSATFPRVDSVWLTAVPPEHSWRRVETVPGAVIRDLVRLGAQAHVEAAANQLGARAANVLLDTPVLVATDGSTRAEITNRTLSALLSMGFLPDHGDVVVAVSGSWTRVAATWGSVFAQDRSDGLKLA